MINKIFTVICLLAASFPAYSDYTGKGKIIFSEGHVNPTCRTVVHKENSTGIERAFRIADVAGDDDVSGVILSALIADRDVDIYYTPGATTGCGTEPGIIFVRIF